MFKKLVLLIAFLVVTTPAFGFIWGSGGGSGDIESVLDDATGAVPVLYQAATAFTSTDATPSVTGHSVFITANASATTITDFDDETSGQIIWVIVNDAVTTFDFTSSGLSGTSDDYLAASGEALCFCYSSVTSKWHYLGFPKVIAAEFKGFTINTVPIVDDTDGKLISSAVTPTEFDMLDGWIMF